eukprot:5176714-Pyramimonas_sp.AAC.1
MRAAKVIAGRCGQSTNGAALKTLLRRLCKHSEQEARQLDEQIDAWAASDGLGAPCENPALAQSTGVEARVAAHKQGEETNCEMLCEPRQRLIERGGREFTEIAHVFKEGNCPA